MIFEHLFDYVSQLHQSRVSSFADRLNFYYSTYFFLSLALALTFTEYVGDPVDCWTPQYFTPMIVELVSQLLQRPPNLRTTSFTDRCNFMYTPIMFAVFCTFTVLSNEVIGDPIDCWTPEFFTAQWIQFVDNICWMKGTYYIPFNATVEEGREEGSAFEIRYYQWIPIIFAALAVLFYTPNFFWNHVVHNTINLNHFVHQLTEGENATDYEERGKCARWMSEALRHYFENRIDFGAKRSRLRGLEYLKQKVRENPLLFWFFKEDYGAYLAPSYLAVKCIYIILGLFTMFFLNSMVGPGFYTFGIEVASNFFAKSDWKSISSQSFPKVTLCNIEIRQVGQPKIQTVQCVLTINLFNEKIFTIVWWWMVFLIMSTCWSLLWWVYKVQLHFVRAKKILFYLKSGEDYQQYQDLEESDPHFQYFVGDYLKPDGAFIFEIIEANSNVAFCSDLMVEMWHAFRRKRENSKKSDDEDEKQTQFPQDEADNASDGISERRNCLCFSKGEKKQLEKELKGRQLSLAEMRQQSLKELMIGARHLTPENDIESSNYNLKKRNSHFSQEFLGKKTKSDNFKSKNKIKMSQSRFGDVGSAKRDRLMERFLDDCNADSSARLEKSGVPKGGDQPVTETTAA